MASITTLCLPLKCASFIKLAKFLLHINVIYNSIFFISLLYFGGGGRYLYNLLNIYVCIHTHMVILTTFPSKIAFNLLDWAASDTVGWTIWTISLKQSYRKIGFSHPVAVIVLSYIDRGFLPDFLFQSNAERQRLHYAIYFSRCGCWKSSRDAVSVIWSFVILQHHSTRFEEEQSSLRPTDFIHLRPPLTIDLRRWGSQGCQFRCFWRSLALCMTFI